MLALLRIQGVVAFLAVAFINAFVDLGHKIIIQNTLFKAYDGAEQVMLTAGVNALILIPFMALLSPAGYISDRFAKPWVMRWAARSAIGITLLITLSYYQGWFEFAFGLTFLMALQSAIYSPAKYGFIRDLVGTDNISEGNSWVQSVTMVAILLGIVCFSLLFEALLPASQGLTPAEILHAIAPLGWLLVLGAIIEAYCAQALPILKDTPVAKPFDWQAYRQGRLLKDTVGQIGSVKAIFRSVCGLAAFWTISQIMLAVFPSYAESTLGATNTFYIQSAMACAGIGILLGSMWAGRLSAQHINTGLIPLGAMGLFCSLWLLPCASSLITASVSFLLIGMSGAFITIPLNALIQFHAPKQDLGKVLAGNNFLQNITMLCGLLLTAGFAVLQVPADYLLISLVIVAGIMFLVTLWLLPEAFIRVLVATLMRQRYRLTVQGFHNLQPEGQGMLLLGNHISWLDWAMVQMACPRPIRFVMERSIYERWYLRGFLNLFGVIPIAKGRGSEQALQEVKTLLKAGEVVCLFPEGAISYTGQLGVFRRGFERAVQGTGVYIVPFYLRGLWGSRWSRAEDSLQAGRQVSWKRDVVVAFGKPLVDNTRADEVKQAVAHLAVTAWQTYIATQPALPELFLHNMKRQAGAVVRNDDGTQPLSRYQHIAAVLLLANYLRTFKQEARVAVLLPTSVSAALVNMAALLAGKVVINLDPTLSRAQLDEQLSVTQASRIVTSAYTLKKFHLSADQLKGLPVVMLESMRDQSHSLQRILSYGAALLPTACLVRYFSVTKNTQSLAAIVVHHGKHEPSSVVGLSHQNIIANVRQLFDLLNRREDERLVGVLPFASAYGLVTQLFLPWLEPLSIVYQTAPTNSLATAKTIARYRASLLFVTPTIIEGLLGNEKIHPAMMASLRWVVSGGSRLTQAQHNAFATRFHQPILEGFGCAPATAVATVNIPDYLNTRWWSIQKGTQSGSVGMALPGTAIRIINTVGQSVPCCEEGEILIGGAQVCHCALTHTVSSQIDTREGVRWYRTGQRGYLDTDGFLILVHSQV